VTGRTPNFFVVGAPKTGTTSLCRYLEQHPDVFMSPIKEPCFFAPEMAAVSPETRARYARERAPLNAYLDGPMSERRDSGFVIEWTDYLKLFKRAREERAVGEGSVAYLGSLHAPRAIRERIPDARIVAVLRDPADRLFSHYKVVRAMGRTALTFPDWAEAERRIEAARDIGWGSVWAGRYGTQLERYLEHFPRAQIHIVMYDDFARDAPATLRSIFEWLGVDPRADVDTRERFNVTAVPRWTELDVAPARRLWGAVKRTLPRRLTARARDWVNGAAQLSYGRDERERIVAMHETEIRLVERLIGRDLSAWRMV
jgi:hypothetical protein